VTDRTFTPNGYVEHIRVALAHRAIPIGPAVDWATVLEFAAGQFCIDVSMSARISERNPIEDVTGAHTAGAPPGLRK
jgi:hypothetical protein